MDIDDVDRMMRGDRLGCHRRFRKAQARAHVLEGLNKAIDALDYIIPLIRNSRSVDEAKTWLTASNLGTL
ncbi:MAG: hypothetical protein ABI623_07365, partial [bacterium]